MEWSRKVFQFIANSGRRAAILAACRANNWHELREKLTEDVRSGDEGLVTEDTVLACLRHGSEWRTQDGKFTDSALDCASLVLAFRLRLRVLSSGLLHGVRSSFAKDKENVLSGVLAEAFGGFKYFDLYLSREHSAMSSCRRQHMLVLVVAAVLGYRKVIEESIGRVTYPSLLSSFDWIMLATVAGHDKLLQTIVAVERPCYYTDDTTVVFPYLLALAAMFGRDLRASLRVFTRHYLNPSRFNGELVSLYDFLDCVVQFVSSTNEPAPTALLASCLEAVCQQAELLFDVDAGYKLQIQKVSSFTKVGKEYFLPFLYKSTQPRSAQSLCFRIFWRLCRNGAGGRFLLDVEHWWDYIDNKFLQKLVYFLVQSVYATSNLCPLTSDSACELCVCPIASFLLYVVYRMEDEQDRMRGDLRSANLTECLQELAGYIEGSSVRLLHCGQGSLCAKHRELFPTSRSLAQVGDTVLRLRGVPSLKVSALEIVLPIFWSAKDLGQFGGLLSYSHLDYVEEMKKELELN